jgi:hypothetical protein
MSVELLSVEEAVAKIEGAAAFEEDDMSASKNPYPKGSRLHEYWRSGYCEAGLRGYGLWQQHFRRFSRLWPAAPLSWLRVR